MFTFRYFIKLASFLIFLDLQMVDNNVHHIMTFPSESEYFQVLMSNSDELRTG